MSEKLKFKVLRPHEGDRPYAEGDEREGTLSELGHLVPKVLEVIGPVESKAERKPANKAKASAPANKSKSAEEK